MKCIFLFVIFVLLFSLFIGFVYVELVVININIVDVIILVELIGVGQSKVEVIVVYCEVNGLFSMFQDLVKVKGIGECMVVKNLVWLIVE